MDKEYWEKFYANQNSDQQPSLFAKFVFENGYVNKNELLIELGCGNGRDSVFMANNKVNVYSTDQCVHEINFLSERFSYLSNIKFVVADFTQLDDFQQFDIVYSRFTLHSIKADEQERVLNWAYRNLNDKGRFCIEVRGHKNEIFKKGEPVENEENAFIYNRHYRRFLKFEELCANLEKEGFKIEFAKEEKGFAPYKGEDETYIRVIAIKY